MTRSARPRPASRSPLAIATAAAVALAGLVAVLVAVSGGGGSSPAPAVAPGGHVTTQGPQDAARVVQVSRDPTDSSEPADGPAHVQLLSGTMPAAAVMATVTSDENCAPDTMGASHCLNRLQMPDGSTMSVRHNHMMGAGVPCLAVGDRVQVVPEG
jgi:hypothetical protein